MIIAVSGISESKLNSNKEYKREFYQPQTKLELKEKIKEDFGTVFKRQESKLDIDILI